MSPRRWLRMPLVFGSVIALVVGLGAGTAYAYFTGVGSGSGTTSVGTVQPVNVIQATGTVTTRLYPGATGDLLVGLNNPNAFLVTIVTIQGNGSPTGSGGIGTCSTTGVSVPTQTVSISVAPGSQTIDVASAISMDLTSDSGCQGATFQVPVTLTVHKG